MRLKSVYLENFRNYRRIEVDTDNDLVVIVGDNASGKTNFIESIYFLAYLKSFRAPDNLLVNSQEDYFKIVAFTDDKKLETIVQVKPTVRRGFKIDDQKIKRLNWRTFRTVLFVPTDLNLFILGPSARRRYLNETLSQLNPAYAADITGLEHVLKQRAALLYNIGINKSERSELDYWDLQLCEISLRLSKSRRDYLGYVGDRFNEIYASLTSIPSEFRIEYKGMPAEYNSDLFLSRLREYQDAEIRSGQNLFGPHRDDFNIYKDGELNIYNSSRGELRAQILSIKLLQSEYLTIGQEKPIILLDDVFSELDETRREMLLNSLHGHQIFITTTDDHNAKAVVPEAKILKTLDNQIIFDPP
ncbi:MAG: DNA replication and repair protein RecF, partial [Candidatus Doudnabacteria bacterium]|nr:DNA replication and repair protein RecF [Candidatus Doudnabacteria bacterium]